MKANTFLISITAFILALSSCESKRKTEANDDSNGNKEVSMKDSLHRNAGMDTKTDENKNQDINEVKVEDLGEVDIAVKRQLSILLNSYFAIKNALVIDDSKTAKVKSSDFIKVTGNVDTKKMTEKQIKFYELHIEKIREDAKHISTTDKIEEQREHFSSLSDNIFNIVKSFQASNGKTYYDHCPMALENKGANWISEKEEISNPYMGSAMPTCGSMKESF